MFLTRAFEIINKEGVLTFRYALGQKMRENMTDEKIYQLYIKNVEPIHNLTLITLVYILAYLYSNLSVPIQRRLSAFLLQSQ